MVINKELFVTYLSKPKIIFFAGSDVSLLSKYGITNFGRSLLRDTTPQIESQLMIFESKHFLREIADTSSMVGGCTRNNEKLLNSC